MTVQGQRILNVALVIITVCAVVSTGFSARRYYGMNGRPPEPQYLVSDWEKYAVTGHRIGPVDAKVTVVVFSDYQCPACKRFMAEIDKVRARYPSVAVVMRHFPLPNHPYAEIAARAAICGEAQGSFARLNDLLFMNADSLGIRPLRTVAEVAGVPDLSAFEKCLVSESTAKVLQADLEAGRGLGIIGTPTLLVNGQQYVGGAAMRLIIERNLRRVVESEAGRS